MHSEYDFLSTYLRRLRRIAPVLAASGAVLAGAVSMALVVGLPLLPRSSMEATVGLFRNSPAADRSLNIPQIPADTAAETTAGSVGATLGAESDSENPSATANMSVETATSLQKTSLPKGALSSSKLDESTPERRRSQSVFSKGQPPRDPVISSVKLPSGAAAQSVGPRLTAGRSKAELPANAAKRVPERNTPALERARPEPFSIQEFLASRP
jgi:hypothetical protein